MPHVAPGDFVLVDSFIDRTTKRSQTFHDQKSANQSSVIFLFQISLVMIWKTISQVYFKLFTLRFFFFSKVFVF